MPRSIPSNSMKVPTAQQEEAVKAMADIILKDAAVTTLEDDSVEFMIPGRDAVTGGTDVTIRLRDMNGSDLLAMEKMPGGDIEKTMRVISRLCIKWGNKDAVTYDMVQKARAKHISMMGQVFANFLN